VLVLGAVMASGTLGVSAQYPEHKKITTVFTGSKYPIQVLNGGDATAFKSRWIDSASSYGKPVIKETSDERYTFFVEGQRFVMLDTDEDGNYFIGADESYGKKSFNTWARGSDDDYMAAYTGNWTYNPERTDNIAYWLNHGFLESGNGGKKLPKSIISSLVEKDWTVEGGNQIKDDVIWKSDVINRLVENPSPQYPENGLESYNVRQQISLMSLTEYVAYSDIFSPRPYNISIDSSSWQDGWILRTPKNLGIKQESNGSVQSSIYFTPQMGGGTGNICALDSSSGHQINVRPVFWLRNDFFKNNAIDTVGTDVLAGEKVIESIKAKYIKGDLTDIYDKQVLVDGFGYPEYAPLAAENVEIEGSLAAGEVLSAAYTYRHESETVEEGATQYQWYVSGAEGGFSKIEGANEKSYTVSEQDIGKSLKVGVRCADINSNLAPESVSDERGIIRERQPLQVVVNSFESADAPSAEFKITADQSGSAVLMIGVYDEVNRLVAMKIETAELAAGENVVSISLNGFEGVKAKVFAVSDMEVMRPYVTAEILK
jgi:hypothetical protein